VSCVIRFWCIFSNLVIKYLVYEAKGQSQSQDFFLKAKAKDVKIFQGQSQGQNFFMKAKAKDFKIFKANAKAT